MKEDIKILEGLLGFISVLNTEQRQALENLIKGYRELEEREIWSTATINGLKRDFIPKSKIKEKIEEYKKKEKCENGKYCNNCCTYYSRCKLLQELMGDK